MNNYSFMPNGDWFVFNVATGKTLARDLSSARAARAWLQAYGSIY